MATRPVVPRATGEGSIGTAAKHWGNGYFDELNTDLIVPQYGSTNNSVGAADRKWKEGHFEKLVADDVTMVFNSVADMRNATELKAGMSARTMGYYSANDGGGALYNIRARNNDTDDGGSIIILDNGYVAELNVNVAVSPSNFGAVGDGVTNDTNAVQAAFNSDFNIVFTKNYAVTSVKIPYKRKLVDFNGFALKYIGNGSHIGCLEFCGIYCSLKNVRIFNATSYGNVAAIHWHSNTSEPSEFNVINRLDIGNFEVGILYGAQIGETPLNISQSENKIIGSDFRGVNICILSNQPNGFLFLSNCTINSKKNEGTYTWTAGNARCIKCVEGTIKVTGSGLYMADNSNGIGLEGKNIYADNCDIEFGGTQMYITGTCAFYNISNGYQGDYSKTPIVIQSGSTGSLILNGFKNRRNTTTAAIPFVKVDGDNVTDNFMVIFDNCVLTGGVYNVVAPLSEVPYIVNKTLIRDTFVDTNQFVIDYRNYEKYTTLQQSSTASVDANNDIVVTAATGATGIFAKPIPCQDYIGAYIVLSEIPNGTKIRINKYDINGTYLATADSTKIVNKIMSTNEMKNPQPIGKIGVYNDSSTTIKIKKIVLIGEIMFD